MINKYIKFKFTNAKFFDKNKRTKDYVIKVTANKKGKIILSDSKRSEEELTSFREPITVHQISNMLHTIVGERPVPSFRKVFYSRNEDIFNIALNSFLKIDSPKIIRKVNGEEIETFIPEFIKVNKSKYNSWSNPKLLYWNKIKKYMGKYYQEFISRLNKTLSYDVEKEPFENLFLIAINTNKFDNLFEWLVKIKKTPIVNFFTKKKFNRSEITKNIQNGLGETLISGIDKVNVIDGEILVPYKDEFANKVIKNSTNILDGGFCEIVGIVYADEIENVDKFKLVSEISDEKY